MIFGSLATAANHSHRGLIWGIVLLASGLAHLAFRHFYARREAAVQTARRETAISPVRRAWIWPTDERSNLIIGTSISAIMIVAGIVVLALSV
jgi:hypothetical protein